MALVDNQGQLLRRHVVPTARDDQVLETLDAMTEFVRACEAQFGQLAGIGVGIAAQVDPRTGAIAGADDNIPGWASIALPEHFLTSHGLRAKVDNDANVAALAEGWVGAARGMRDFILLTLGTGVGGGIVAGGQCVVGASGGAGELGHMPIIPDGPACYCGSHGCLERLVAGPYLLERAREAGLLVSLPSDLFHLAAEGNADAARLVRSTGYELALGVVTLINIFQPAAIVFGGGLAAYALPSWLEAIRVVVEARALPNNRQVRLLPAALGADAGVIGAARLATF
jgi:glucokinase